MTEQVAELVAQHNRLKTLGRELYRILGIKGDIPDWELIQKSVEKQQRRIKELEQQIEFWKRCEETTMKFVEVKPCPFCGTVQDRFGSYSTWDSKHHFAVCKKCGAQGPVVEDNGDPETLTFRAAERWNRRTPEET